MFWTVALIVIIIVIFIAKILLNKKEQAFDIASYQKKTRVMNESEQALFINLQKALGDAYIVLSKVRIEDFVDVDKKNISNNSHWGLRGKIKSRHVDFLVCDHATTKPLLAIELDGKSHNDPRRKNRDQFVDELYNVIGLPIKHIPVGGNFLELAQKISNHLRADADNQQL